MSEPCVRRGLSCLKFERGDGLCLAVGPCVREFTDVPDGVAAHALERAFDRYGIVLKLADLRALEERVSRGDGMMLRRDPGRAEIRVVRVDGQLVTVAFSPDDKRIKTFLPAGTPTQKRRYWLRQAPLREDRR